MSSAAAKTKREKMKAYAKELNERKKGATSISRNETRTARPVTSSTRSNPPSSTRIVARTTNNIPRGIGRTTQRVTKPTVARTVKPTRKPLTTVSANTTRARQTQPLGKRAPTSSIRGAAPPAKRQRTARTTSRAVSRTESNALAKAVSEEKKKEFLELKQQVAKLAEHNTALSSSLVEYESNLSCTVNSIATLSANVAQEQMKQISLQGNRDRLKLEVAEKSDTTQLLQTTLKDTKERFAMQLEGEQAKYEALSSTHKTLKQQNSLTSNELSNAKKEIVSQQKMHSNNERAIRETTENLNESVQQSEGHASTILSLRSHIEEYDQQIAVLQEQARNDELQRRKLHDTILDLKGTVRVFIRVCEQEDNDECDFFSYPDPWRGQTLQLNQTEGFEKILQFEFDKVFAASTPDQELHNEMKSLIRSSVAGNTINIFTYGTHNASPFNSSSQFRQLISFITSEVLQTTKKYASKGWIFSKFIQAVSIAGDKTEDILSHVIPDGEEEPLTRLDGANYIQIQNVKQCNQEIDASSSRSMETEEAPTILFQIQLSAINQSTGEASSGLINLVCLAPPHSSIDTTSTNTLSQVITALANQEPVPFRRSKLTSLLRRNLNGSAKTLFIVNLRNTKDQVEEHLQSLRFAKEINSCNIGNAPIPSKKKRRK